MSKDTVEIARDITVRVYSVVCGCGCDLTYSIEADTDGDITVTAEACADCLRKERDEGWEEGKAEPVV